MAMALDDAKAIEAAFEAAQAQDPRAARRRARRAVRRTTRCPPLLWSGAVALATPWPLLLFTRLSAERIFTAQLALCLVALAFVLLAPMRIALDAAQRAPRPCPPRGARAIRRSRTGPCARAQRRADLCLARRALCANRRRRGREPNHQRRTMAGAGRRADPAIFPRRARNRRSAKPRRAARSCSRRDFPPNSAGRRQWARAFTKFSDASTEFRLVLRSAPFVFTRRRRNSPAAPRRAPSRRPDRAWPFG